jgi:RNA polymerase sigma factor (sigma-70 family)
MHDSSESDSPDRLLNISSDSVDRSPSPDANANDDGQSLDPMASDSDELTELSAWLRRVRTGDVEAIDQLCRRYLDRSIRQAKSRLKLSELRLIDEEQAAMSALQSLIGRVRGGSYGEVNDELQFWSLLASIINRKVIKYRRSVYGPTRSPELPLLPVDQVDGDSSHGGDGCPADGSPSPISAAIAKETLDQILDRLPDADSRQVLLLRMEGHNDVEISELVGHSRNWVARRVGSIRRVTKAILRDDP